MVKKTIKEEKITKKNSLKENIVSEEWKKIKLGNLFNISSSRRVLQSQWKSNGVPFYRGREITALSKNGEVDNKLFISKELYNEYASKYGIPKTSDIMITAIGTIGNSYVVKETDKFYFKDASVLWLNKKSDVDSEFINYWLKSREFFQQLDKGNGSTVDTLTVERLQNVLCTLPASPEQQKIVTILSNVDNLINSTQKIIDQTITLKKGLMQKLLTKGIGHKKFKKVNFHFGKIIKIPEEWEVKQLKEYVSKIGSGVTPKGGSSVYLKKGIPLIRSQNVHFEGLSLENVAFISEEIHNDMKNTQLMEYDVLLNITGASIGRCTYIPTNFGEGNVNQHVCIIRPKAKLFYSFLAYVLSSNLLQNIIQSSQVGLSREGLNFKEIGDFVFPLPSLPEQKQIASILSNVDSQIQSQTQYKEKLERLKKSLMQKLLTGEVRVIV